MTNVFASSDHSGHADLLIEARLHLNDLRTRSMFCMFPRKKEFLERLRYLENLLPDPTACATILTTEIPKHTNGRLVL